jgi:hypothetical protein
MINLIGNVLEGDSAEVLFQEWERRRAFLGEGIVYNRQRDLNDDVGPTPKVPPMKTCVEPWGEN